jgi:hypothetical protein
MVEERSKPIIRGYWARALPGLSIDDPRVLCAFVFLFSVAVMFLWHLYTQLEAGDSAIWDYVAQSILRGQVPYRDVVEIKGPASAYLSAIAMWLGKFVGLRDVMAVRFMQILIAGVLSVVTFMVVETYLRLRTAAFIASLFPLMSYHFVSWTAGGTQPKLTMILFGMLALLLMAKDRPFWAGFCSMLSCLSWQPGLLFTGVAVLVLSRYLTSWRDWRALRVVFGAMLPLGVTLLYFHQVGAFTDFWMWTVSYNYEVYAPGGIRTLSETVAHIWTVSGRVFNLDSIWVAFGLAGLLMFTAQRLRSKLNLRLALNSPELFKDALAIAPLVYLAFCLVNLQSGPDLMPLFPFIGIFAAWFIVEFSRLLNGTRPISREPRLCRLIETLPSLVLLLVLAVAVFRAATHKMEEWTLSYQEQQLAKMSGLIGPDDKIYVHGTLEILVLLNRPNLNPYIMWDHGKVGYIAAKKYGGSVNALIDAIEAERPKFVALSRLKLVPEGAALEHWLEANYDKLPITGYEVHVRRAPVVSLCAPFRDLWLGSGQAAWTLLESADTL